MKMIVESEEVTVRSGTSKAGSPFEIAQQQARVVGEILAGPIEIVLDSKDKPIKIGEYEIDFERSVKFGRFGRLELAARPSLKPIGHQVMNMKKTA